MDYQTLIVKETQKHGLSVTLNRLENQNALNYQLIHELHEVLNAVENNPSCRFIILKGQSGIFCTGMDFKELSQNMAQGINEEETKKFVSSYLTLLRRFSLSPKIIITEIDGKVMAGGIGLVAASDIVIATSASQFTLSEALWGLLPANVMPYLIRRVGFQPAYFMTLTTQTLSAKDAHSFRLVDELSDDIEAAERKYLLRLTRLDEKTILDLKSYFRKLWIVDDTMEQTAIAELVRLLKEPRILNNITRFIQKGKFPWESNNG
jgi:polyketide biosynthesis enoyl-CoA hydratase PksH